MASRYRVYVLIGAAALLVWLGAGSPDEVSVAKPVEVLTPAPPLAVMPRETAELNNVPAALPAKLQRIALEDARRNPFALPPPPALALAKPIPAPLPPPLPVAPPPAPSPPALNLTFAGRMTAPDGSQVVYVNYANEALALVVGQTLPNGYRVEAITARAVELSYPPLNTTARLDLPASPKYEIR